MCNYACVDQGGLTKHKMRHAGNKPYKCDLCDYRATEAGPLKKHKLVHTGKA